MSSSSKAVLITGAARRVGAELVRGFSGIGFRVALHFQHSEDEARAMAQETGATCYHSNLTDEGAAHRLIEHVMADMPNLCGLVNNASTFRRAHLIEASEADIARDIAINLTAPMILMREYAIQAKRGFIINMLDTAIYDTHPAHFAYLVAKKGLAGATEMAAREWIGQIRVNAICPGHVLPTEGQGVAPHEPAVRGVQPTVDQVVEAALILAENESFTGQFLNIDGGEKIL